MSELIEAIQELIVKAGGNFKKQSEIKDMTLLELSEMLDPNMTNISIRFSPKEIDLVKLMRGDVADKLEF